MNEKNTKKLIDDFPVLYKNDFYFECDDGWFELIYNLSKEVNDIIKDLSKEAQETTKVTQVKEKFGSLRWYVDLPYESLEENHLSELNRKIENIIYKFEEKSETTCESCGNVGKIKKINNWLLKCICENCEIIKDIII